jgi:tetratricopeptide (TPR) repeat protein
MEPPVERFEQLVPVDDASPVDTGEIDLSSLLTDLQIGTAAEARPAALPVVDNNSADPAKLFERAQEHLRAGAVAEAAAALQAAASSPQHRFKAAAQLGRLLISRGDFHGGAEWLERAASAPSPSPDDTTAVIYDLADALARAGEHVRALAIFMELEADAGAFRDVRARIDQLTSTTSMNGDRA